MFVDESGQFRRPHEGAPPEHGLVVGVLFRDTPGNRARLADVVRALRLRHGRRVKGSKLDDGDYASICALVADVGYLAPIGVHFDRQHGEACAAMLVDLVREFEHLPQRTARDVLILAAMRRTQLELESAVGRNLGTYLVQLVFMIRQVAAWFRAEGIFPDMDVTLDEKLVASDRDLIAFVPRLAVATVFPELYENRLSAIWAERGPTSGVVSTDELSDGLVIADALAYAYGRVQRGQDASGLFASRIAACTRERD